jgi:hypothetical protein
MLNVSGKLAKAVPWCDNEWGHSEGVLNWPIMSWQRGKADES